MNICGIRVSIVCPQEVDRTINADRLSPIAFARTYLRQTAPNTKTAITLRALTASAPNQIIGKSHRFPMLQDDYATTSFVCLIIIVLHLICLSNKTSSAGIVFCFYRIFHPLRLSMLSVFLPTSAKYLCSMSGYRVMDVLQPRQRARCGSKSFLPNKMLAAQPTNINTFYRDQNRNKNK